MQQSGIFSHGTINLVIAVLIVLSMPLVENSVDSSGIPISNNNAPWSSQGQNLQNTWYSPQTMINPSNVRSLKLAWFAGIPLAAGTPIVSGGLVYIGSGGYAPGPIFALNESTGAIVWEDAPNNQTNLSFSTTAGVAVSDGHVFAATGTNQLVELNATTGRVEWNVSITNGILGTPIYYNGPPAAPLVYDGEVIVGESSGELGSRGFVRALSELNGSVLWTFYTVPPSPMNSTDQGFYLNSWGNCTQCGGGDVWSTPAAIDGVIYFGTGNPSPSFNVSERAPSSNDSNLYSDSVIALNASTGKMIWYFQETQADTHDWDQGVPVSVFSTMIHGEWTRVIGAGSKDGYYYLLNATNGSLIHKVKLGIHENENLKPTPQGVIVYPGPNGGINTFSSYDPMTNKIYAETYNDPANLTEGPINFTSGNYLGTVENDVPNAIPNSTFYSIDASTGDILWLWNLPGNYSGGVSSSNNLVFTTDGNGTFYALDASNLKVLWKYDTGGSFGTYFGLWNFGPPSITDGMLFDTLIGGNGGVMAFSTNASVSGYNYNSTEYGNVSSSTSRSIHEALNNSSSNDASILVTTAPDKVTTTRPVMIAINSSSSSMLDQKLESYPNPSLLVIIALVICGTVAIFVVVRRID